MKVTIETPCGSTVVEGEITRVTAVDEEKTWTTFAEAPSAEAADAGPESKPTAEPTPTATAEGASAETVDQEGAGKEQAAIPEGETAPPAAAPEAEPTGEGTGAEAAGTTTTAANGDGEGEGALTPSAVPEPGPEAISQLPPAQKTSEEGGAPTQE